jgi:glutathione synthase/RimK-type ligase-like ATP-grasp enzyme
MLVVLYQSGGNDNSLRVMEACRRLKREYFCLDVDVIFGKCMRRWDTREDLDYKYIGGCDLNQAKAIFNGVFAKIGRNISAKSSQEYSVFICQELHDILFGSLLNLNGVLWMNNPQQVMLANLKTLQLSIARDFGFIIPKTVMSNSREVLMDFFSQMKGNVVTKAIHMGNISSNGDSQHTLLYTSKVNKESLDILQETNAIPILLQEYIANKSELRVVVIGDRVFTCVVNDDNESVDWRVMPEAIQSSFSIDLPYCVSEKCKELVRHLGLLCGVIDIVKDKTTGDYYFLEINQQGTWNWMEEKLGLPIGDSIVKLLSA